MVSRQWYFKKSNTKEKKSQIHHSYLNPHPSFLLQNSATDICVYWGSISFSVVGMVSKKTNNRYWHMRTISPFQTPLFIMYYKWGIDFTTKSRAIPAVNRGEGLRVVTLAGGDFTNLELHTPQVLLSFSFFLG